MHEADETDGLLLSPTARADADADANSLLESPGGVDNLDELRTAELPSSKRA